MNEPRSPSAPSAVSRRPPLALPGLPPLGALSLGALAVCVASGLVLLPGFQPARAAASILEMETSRPWAWFFRNLHAWSALILLITLALHSWEFLWRHADREYGRLRWVAVVSTLPVTLYLMLGGLALIGDAEAGGVTAMLRGIPELVPLIGGALATVLAGGPDRKLLYVQHVLTATVALIALVLVHLRKRALPDVVATASALGLAGLIALFARPSLGPLETVEPLHGPWFMAGLRWLLERTPAWTTGLLLPVSLFAILAALPWFSERTARAVRYLLGTALLSYAALNTGAWLWP